MPTASLPRATDVQLLQDDRLVDITEIGVNTRSHEKLSEITFPHEAAEEEADAAKKT